MTDDLDACRMHLSQAYTRAVHPDARRHIRAALQRLDGEEPDAQLVGCHSCGRVGLPEQIAAHECTAHANPDPVG